MRFPGIAYALLSPQSFCMLVTHWSPKIRSHGTACIIIVSSSVSLLDTLFWYCSYNHWLTRCYFANCWLTRHGLRWLNCCCAPLRLVDDLLIIIAGYSGYASLVPLMLLVCGLLAHRTWCMVAQGWFSNITRAFIVLLVICLSVAGLPNIVCSHSRCAPLALRLLFFYSFVTQQVQLSVYWIGLTICCHLKLAVSELCPQTITPHTEGKKPNSTSTHRN